MMGWEGRVRLRPRALARTHKPSGLPDYECVESVGLSLHALFYICPILLSILSRVNTYLNNAIVHQSVWSLYV